MRISDWSSTCALPICAATLLPYAWTQVGILAAAGLAGSMWLAPPGQTTHPELPIAIGRRAGAAWLLLFAALLAGLPVAAALFPDPALVLVDAFYRAGSLVFGGGHVVLPLLQAEVVRPGRSAAPPSDLQSLMR